MIIMMKFYHLKYIFIIYIYIYIMNIFIYIYDKLIIMLNIFQL